MPGDETSNTYRVGIGSSTSMISSMSRENREQSSSVTPPSLSINMRTSASRFVPDKLTFTSSTLRSAATLSAICRTRSVIKLFSISLTQNKKWVRNPLDTYSAHLSQQTTSIPKGTVEGKLLR